MLQGTRKGKDSQYLVPLRLSKEKQTEDMLAKEAKFERGAAQAGLGIGLDFFFSSPAMYAHQLR